MQGAEHVKRFQHHQCQCALQDIFLLFHSDRWVSNRKHSTALLGKQQGSYTKSVNSTGHLMCKRHPVSYSLLKMVLWTIVSPRSLPWLTLAPQVKPGFPKSSTSSTKLRRLSPFSLAGQWAYLNYLRGRTFKRRLEPVPVPAE